MSSHDPHEIDWANIVDLLASEYGWTIEYIRTLDLGQVIALKAKIQARYDHKNGEVSSDTGAVPSSEDDFKASDFEKLGGKRNVREDGTVEIII